MTFNLLPKIRVHSWGGFGSQLNTIALVHDLSNRFPERKIEILMRTGGVHAATFELEDLGFNDLKITNLQIQNSNFISENIKVDSKLHKLKTLLTYGLYKTGLYSTCNSRKDFNSLKPWILTIRGSYNFYPSDSFLDYLSKKLKSDYNDSYAKYNLIHYRLGDLITLQTKKPIEEEVIIEQAKQMFLSSLNPNFCVISSDPEIAKNKFAAFNLPYKIDFLYVKPSDVLKFGMRGTSFIGTNSKMSIWVVMLRLHSKVGFNLLPRDFKKYFDNLLIQGFEKDILDFY